MGCVETCIRGCDEELDMIGYCLDWIQYQRDQLLLTFLSRVRGLTEEYIFEVVFLVDEARRRGC